MSQVDAGLVCFSINAVKRGVLVLLMVTLLLLLF